jgi:chromosome partitioning protein
MILVIGSEKGGCAKSTLALNLSIVSVLEGIDTLLVDADTQGSCNEFSQRRDELGVAPRLQVMMKHGRNLHRELSDLKNRYQRIIVDTGGRDSPELRSSLLVADAVLIPVQPTQLDLWATEKAFQVTATAQDLNPYLHIWVVITRAHTNLLVTTARDAMHFLSDFSGVTLCHTILHERLAWQKSILEGRSVVELRDAKARQEMQLIYGEIFDGRVPQV